MKGSLKDIMLARHPSEVTRERFIIEMNMPTEYPAISARPTAEGGVRDRFFASVAELPEEVTVIHPFNVDAFAESNSRTLYVSTSGDDSADGTESTPLATPAEALRRLEGACGGRIILREGAHDLDDTLVIDSRHSGSESSPLIITAYPGEKPMLSTSRSIPASAFTHVTDESVLARLGKDVGEHVLEADLGALGITEFGKPGVGGAVLLINSVEQDLARYPNRGEKLLEVSERIVCTGWNEEEHRPNGDWEIGVDDDRPYTWQKADDICVFGAFTYEWVRLNRRLGAICTDTRTIRGIGSFDHAPVQHRGNNTFFFTNVLDELDAPGEWYLDRSSGKLYVYPPNGDFSKDDDIRFISRAQRVISCEGAENVIVDRIDIGRCCGNAVNVSDCRQVLFQRCRICGTTGIANDDGSAVEVEGGFRSGIIDSVIEHFSNRAASVGGGDRKTLTPANNFIQNCKVINPHCRFGISSGGGVGNIVSHNYSLNTTMGDGGSNEGIIEYNIVEGGDTETHDTGMIYVAGGGCSTCGNHYRYNYFFDFAMGDYGIYFDDLSRGMYAYGNIVVGNGTLPDDDHNWYGGGRSFNHHNGCEHCYWNNISIDAGYFAFGGDISYWISDSHWNSLFPGMLGASRNMGTERYFGRYPTYRDYAASLAEYDELRKAEDYVTYSSDAERRTRSPFANHYENNLIFRAARPYKLDNGLETATGLETNYITSDDPGFVDLENRDYRFREDAEVFEKIPGFIAPPFERMGPTED